MQEFGNNEHKIYQGEAIEILQNNIKDNSVDLIFMIFPKTPEMKVSSYRGILNS